MEREKRPLFRILGGILKADSGQVRIAGRDPYRHRRQIFRHLGIVPETRSLYLRLTVYEHLYLFGAFHDLTPDLSQTPNSRLKRDLKPRLPPNHTPIKTSLKDNKSASLSPAP